MDEGEDDPKRYCDCLKGVNDDVAPERRDEFNQSDATVDRLRPRLDPLKCYRTARAVRPATGGVRGSRSHCGLDHRQADLRFRLQLSAQPLVIRRVFLGELLERSDRLGSQRKARIDLGLLDESG